jgi:hypothetical protein
VEESPPSNGDDLKRADDVDAEEFDPRAGSRAAFDIMDAIGPDVFWHPKPARGEGD